MIKNGKIYKSYKARAEAAEARAAQLEIVSDEMQEYVNEIRVALHTEKDELTIEAVRRVVAERDAARLELQQIRTMLDDGDRDDFTALDMVKRLHAHDYALEAAQRTIEAQAKELNHYHRLQADIDMGVIELVMPGEVAEVIDPDELQLP